MDDASPSPPKGARAEFLLPPLELTDLALSTPTIALLQQCAPMPDDVDATDAATTACAYCGISYLLRTKYNALTTHMARLESELVTWKRYAIEHPVLVSRCEGLEMNLRESEGARTDALERVRVLESDLSGLRDENGRNVRALHELQLRHTKVTHEFETHVRSAELLEESLRGQIKGLVALSRDIKERVGPLRGEVELVKREMTSMIRQEAKDAMDSVSETMRAALPALLRSHVDATLRPVVKDHENVTNLLRDEISMLREDLQNAEKRSQSLEQDIEHQRSEYDTVIDGKNDDLSYLRTQNLNQEKELDNMRDQLSELKTALTALQSATSDLSERLRASQSALKSLQSTTSAKEQSYVEVVRRLEDEATALRKQIEDLRALSQDQDARIDAARARELLARDEQIAALNKTISTLNATIASMRDERAKTIEAHQSRLKHLQDRFTERLEMELKDAVEGRERELRDGFEREKVESVRQLKEMFQSQLAAVKNPLTSQLDAARLSRDNAWSEVRKRKTEIESLKEEISTLRSQLTEIQSRPQPPPPKPATPPPLPTPPQMVPAELMGLEDAVRARDAEIAFLKETVRVECEERMGLLAALDEMRRGTTTGRASVSTVERRTTTPSGDKGAKDVAVASPAPMDGDDGLYRSLAAAAAVKKSRKLRSLTPKLRLQ